MAPISATLRNYPSRKRQSNPIHTPPKKPNKTKSKPLVWPPLSMPIGTFPAVCFSLKSWSNLSEIHEIIFLMHFEYPYNHPSYNEFLLPNSLRKNACFGGDRLDKPTRSVPDLTSSILQTFITTVNYTRKEQAEFFFFLEKSLSRWGTEPHMDPWHSN